MDLAGIGWLKGLDKISGKSGFLPLRARFLTRLKCAGFGMTSFYLIRNDVFLSIRNDVLLGKIEFQKVIFSASCICLGAYEFVVCSGLLGIWKWPG
jgi:hypothetical protein